MNILDAFIMGLVQGITEFLPVSSSGHLVVVREFFGISMEGGLAFDILLHIATLLVVIIYFRSTILRLIKSAFGIAWGRSVSREDKILIGGIVIGTIPAVVIGILWGDLMTDTFRNTLWVVGALVFGSAVFWLAERKGKQKRELTYKSSLFIGFYQVLAFIPGMSRSGITISGGLFSGLTRKDSAEFSFLLAIPAIAGAGLMPILDGSIADIYSIGISAIVGALTAFISGFIAIHFLMKFVRTHSLDIFIVYRLLLAGGILLALFVF